MGAIFMKLGRAPTTKRYFVVFDEDIGRECLPADNSINTGPSEIILDKSPRLCHREMDASPQSRWLLGSGEGTRTDSRVPAAAIGARTGGERALAEAAGTSAASQQAKCRTVFQGGTQKCP